MTITNEQAREALKQLDRIADYGDVLALETLRTFITQSAENARIAEAVRCGDEAVVFDDNSIYHTDECEPKHYGRVLIIPASVLGGEEATP